MILISFRIPQATPFSLFLAPTTETIMFQSNVLLLYIPTMPSVSDASLMDFHYVWITPHTRQANVILKGSSVHILSGFLISLILRNTLSPDKRSIRCFFFFCLFFLVFYTDICCGYSLEAPQWGASYEYSQYTYSWKIWEIRRVFFLYIKIVSFLMIYSRLSLSRSPRDSLIHFEISVPRHIRFAELKKTLNRTTTFNKMNM